MFGTVALGISESSLAQSTWKFLIHMVVSRSSGKESNPSAFLLKSDLFHYSLLVGITVTGQPGKCCCECRIRYQFFRWNWNKDCFTAIRVDFIFLSFKVTQLLACHRLRISLFVLPICPFIFILDFFGLRSPSNYGTDYEEWHVQYKIIYWILFDKKNVVKLEETTPTFSNKHNSFI